MFSPFNDVGDEYQICAHESVSFLNVCGYGYAIRKIILCACCGGEYDEDHHDDASGCAYLNNGRVCVGGSLCFAAKVQSA